MGFDYFNVEMRDSSQGTLRTIDIQKKMNRFLFALWLYPNFPFAANFASVGDVYHFLTYWLGTDIYERLRKDVAARRRDIGNIRVYEIMRDLFQLCEGRPDLLELFTTKFYSMMIGKRFIDEEPELKLEGGFTFFKEHDVEEDPLLTFFSVVENLDYYIKLSKEFEHPEFAPGKYWLIYLGEEDVKREKRPYLLLGRINDEGKISYLQGGWPLQYLINGIQRIVTRGKLKYWVGKDIHDRVKKLAYRAEHGKYCYIRIIAEKLPLGDKSKYPFKYTGVTEEEGP